ncbi:hypothetical protein SLEP1_g27729 [Rubroshorea leprosula]|uniref:Uncharacterized protein n=1 Tax=Rubroshorea leprosula TaxID=152421 RepID=A0AAV5K116_9ROSI|nr:hypothetical protein SLEP1_g27729 [Rubroshorea leprosula]
MANMGAIASLVMSVTINEDDEMMMMWTGIKRRPEDRGAWCDGAALYYKDKLWLLGVTPMEVQIRELAQWLLEYHGGSTGLSTDSLMEAGYLAKEIKWGGAKHDPDDKDDGRKMHPTSSFKAFLEVVDYANAVVNVPSVDDRIQRVDELHIVTNEMIGLTVEQAIGMPFADLVEDESTDIVKNMLSLALQGIEERTVEIKLRKFGCQETMRKFDWQENNGPIIVVVNACCSRDLKDNVIGVCLVGQDVTGQKVVMERYNHMQGKYVKALLSANKRIDAEGRIIGVLCFLHVASPELQYALQVQRLSEQAAANSLNKLAYIRQELKKPLNGIVLMQDLLGSSELDKEQKKLLKTSIMCQEQLTKIVNDKDV